VRVPSVGAGLGTVPPMFRAVGAGVVVLTLVLSGCSGGSATALGASKACPLLAQLARTGETVARADVSDPAVFDHTIRSATTEYVRTARKLRDAVPERLRADVERMIAAVQQRRFADADGARAHIDDYARAVCTDRKAG
jgi:hypothetical protein